MSIEAWRRAYRWLRLAFLAAWVVTGVRVVLGEEPADHRAWWLVYLAVWGLFLLSDTALRAAERRHARSGAEATQRG